MIQGQNYASKRAAPNKIRVSGDRCACFKVHRLLPVIGGTVKTKRGIFPAVRLPLPEICRRRFFNTSFMARKIF
jgi:hypothetical protein